METNYNLRIELLESGIIIETYLKNYRRGLNCTKLHLKWEGTFDNTNNKEFLMELCKNRTFENENIKAYLF